MPSVSDIRHRIKTIQQTRQITNAMYLLSKSRIRKVLQSMEKNRAYSLRIQAAMKDILINSQDLEGTHPDIEIESGETAMQRCLKEIKKLQK